MIYVGENGLAFPLALFASAAAGIPFLPLNYRLAPEQLAAIVGRQERPFIIGENADQLRSDAAAGAAGIGEWVTCSPGRPWAAPWRRPSRSRTTRPCC